MRLLLWVLLATLVTLLGSVDSVSSSIANKDSAHPIKFVDNAVGAAHNKKRRLRSSNQVADDEERMNKIPLTLDDIIHQAKLEQTVKKYHNWLKNRKTKPTVSRLPQPQPPRGANPSTLDNGLPVPAPPRGVRSE
ncbi:RxLR effector protein [Phytophthora megakarya]|uniref:RxLR effector protein n=1 Tax=Phytophthora megakarya TaxID=4795 RepID=A0A225VCK7_9STRA|nr:RxLR effector protein [Phytophthora megakarya]